MNILTALTVSAFLISSCQKSPVNADQSAIAGQFLIEASSSKEPSSSIGIGLLAYYPFTGNANDLSGNGNTGTVSGAQLTKDRFGRTGRAYSFGTNRTITVNTPTSALNLLGSFSISTWFKMDTLANAYNASVLLNKHNADAGNDGWVMGVWDPNHDTLSQIINFQGNNNYNVSTYPGSAGVVHTGKWYHMVVTYESVNKVFSYWLNGTLIMQKILPFDLLPNASPMTIGYATSSGLYNDYFRGTIDEIRLYGRVLTNAEISYLFKNS